MDGRHGRLDKGERHCTVEVVYDLDRVSEMLCSRADDGSGSRETHEQCPEYLVLPRQISDTMLRRKGIHHVQQGDKAGDLHGEPGDPAWDIEDAVRRRLAHAIPWQEILNDAALFHISRGSLTVRHVAQS